MDVQTFETTEACAQALDENDVLKHFRSEFHIPEKNGKPMLYFTGNSLGLQAKRVQSFMQQQLDKWANQGVEGHFSGEYPWFDYHKQGKETLAILTGSSVNEVVPMNNLTSNLHLLMVSFYRPHAKRYKILMESGAFPSDQYAVESQVRFHGYEPDDAIIEVAPRPGELTLRKEDLIKTIHQHGDEIALVMMSGVQYFTGQKFPIREITKAAHQVGALAGFDLAHAIGNVELNLHDDDVDFAVWCTYKYLNSGPGGVSGIFVHERFSERPDLPRFAGWWGYDQDSRFLMKKGFIPMKGADGWQLSNVNILGSVGHVAALTVIREAGWENLLGKSRTLTAYLEYLLEEIQTRHDAFQIITPREPDERGCQLSLFFPSGGREVFEYLESRGVIGDWREDHFSESGERSGVIRIAPVPMYNSYRDVYQFSVLLDKALGHGK